MTGRDVAHRPRERKRLAGNGDDEAKADAFRQHLANRPVGGFMALHLRWFRGASVAEAKDQQSLHNSFENNLLGRVCLSLCVSASTAMEPVLRAVPTIPVSPRARTDRTSTLAAHPLRFQGAGTRWPRRMAITSITTPVTVHRTSANIDCSMPNVPPVKKLGPSILA